MNQTIKKVLFFTKFTKFGGTEQSIILLSRELQKSDIACTVYLAQKGPFYQRLKKNSIQIRMGRARWISMRDITCIKEWVKKEKFDLVFLHHKRVWAILFHLLRVPVVQRVNLPQDAKILRWGSFPGVDWFFGKFIVKYISVSNDIQRSMLQRNIPDEKISVIRNGVDYSALKLLQKIPRSAIGLLNTDYVIGSIGRLTYQKGFDILIDAFYKFQKKCEEARLLIIGSGPLEQKLKEKVNRLSLSSKVVWVSYREDPGAWMKVMDVFVLASRWEGLANVLLEAMACGCPVITTHSEGVNELIIDGFCGRVVPVGDTDAICDALRYLQQNPTVVEQYVKEGINKIQKDYALKRMGQETLRLIKDIHEHRHP